MTVIPDFAQAANSIMQNKLPGAAWTWVNSSSHAKVARYQVEFTESASALAKIYYLKIFMPRSKWEWLKTWVRGSRCNRAVQASAQLTQAGFLTPTIVACGELGRGVRAVSWMSSEGVEALGLWTYLSNYLRRPYSPNGLRWKRQIITALGELVGSLHRQGIVHGDLRLNNILIDIKASTPIFYLIDNERNRQFNRDIPKRLLLKNLVQLNMLHAKDASQTDRLRFLRAYHRLYLTGRKDLDLKVVVRQVHQRTHRRQQRKYYSEQPAPLPDFIVRDRHKGVSNVPAE